VQDEIVQYSCQILHNIHSTYEGWLKGNNPCTRTVMVTHIRYVS